MQDAALLRVSWLAIAFSFWVKIVHFGLFCKGIDFFWLGAGDWICDGCFMWVSWIVRLELVKAIFYYKSPPKACMVSI